MSTPIPPPLRAVAGLAAVAIDNARKLPEQLVGLPVLAVSAALQVSLKAQQRYAALIARGDEVLGQLRGVEDAPAWARFDEEPGPAARPRSAFEAVAEVDVLDELAGDLARGEPEADLLADAEAGLDGGPVLEPDGVAATEAQVGGLDVAEVPLYETAPGVDLPAGAVTGGAAAEAALGDAGEPAASPAGGREPGSVGEPGVDLPAGSAADAAAVGQALDAAAGADPLAGADTDGRPADPLADTDSRPADPAGGLDGYLAVDPPIPHYDELSIPQLRGRLRSLTETQLEELVAYERATAARPPYLTMLENRLVTLRSR